MMEFDKWHNARCDVVGWSYLQCRALTLDDFSFASLGGLKNLFSSHRNKDLKTFRVKWTLSQ